MRKRFGEAHQREEVSQSFPGLQPHFSERKPAHGSVAEMHCPPCAEPREMETPKR